MTEELKQQVGEHIPTVIPLMAKAMGVDVKELFKMMERGQLDPMTALPKLAALMKTMSASAMAEFQQSLPYKQGVATENRQMWMQDFNKNGGTEGLTRFWTVMGQIIGDTQTSAETLGNTFLKVTSGFSNALLVPQEFIRWIKGETDERNLWQRMFGDSGTNGGLQSTLNSLNSIKDSLMEVVNLANRVSMMASGTTSADSARQNSNMFQVGREAAYGFGVLAEGGGALLNTATKVVVGDFGGARESWGGWQDRSKNLGVEYDAKGYARNYMQQTYGDDESKWNPEVQRARYNGYMSRNSVSSSSSPTNQIGMFGMPSNDMTSVMDSRQSSGGQITVIDNSKVELNVSGMAIDNAQAIQNMVRVENEKRINTLLNAGTLPFLRIPQ